ncbi:MAG: hypothetical protein LBD23_16010 [Oscillospiraceae bacterium]|jgi:hypothetical protein|nr:hypothetical protein [Oscillospiraceae bacterium]
MMNKVTEANKKPDSVFELSIDILKPSQLYISDEKLKHVNDWFDPNKKENFEPIPIKLYNGKYMITDGHTRIMAAIQAGWETVPVTWDNDPLDMLVYGTCVSWCDEEGINSVRDLTERIISHEDYETLWYKRCREIATATQENRPPVSSDVEET